MSWNRFVFWSNMPAHIQAPFIAAVAERCPDGVFVAFAGPISEDRRKLGWPDPDYGGATVSIGLTPQTIREIIAAAGPDAVHVFAGLGAYPGVHAAFRQCAGEGRNLGLMSESSPAAGLGGVARLLAGRFRRIKSGANIAFILAIGESAPWWFRMMGFKRERIFDFAYFTTFPALPEEPDPALWNGPGEGNPVRLLFIGQLIRRKGIDKLLRALSAISTRNWRLCLIGTGSLESELAALSRQLGLAEQVLFRGPRDNAGAMSAIAGCDVLILPSRFDGWGAVVNEALQRGVPVICSDRCGARQVVQSRPEFGTVFGSIRDLRTALERTILQGRITAERTTRIRESALTLSPEAGAEYFLKVMAHVQGEALRPTAPWRFTTGQDSN